LDGAAAEPASPAACGVRDPTTAKPDDETETPAVNSTNDSTMAVVLANAAHGRRGLSYESGTTHILKHSRVAPNT